MEQGEGEREGDLDTWGGQWFDITVNLDDSRYSAYRKDCGDLTRNKAEESC